MTYFGFLALFLGIPLVLLIIITWRDHDKNKTPSSTLQGGTPWAAIPALIIIAVVYTTPGIITWLLPVCGGTILGWSQALLWAGSP